MVKSRMRKSRRKSKTRRTNKKCKYGALKRPVRNKETGRMRYCKLKPKVKKSKTKRRSRRKLKPKVKKSKTKRRSRRKSKAKSKSMRKSFDDYTINVFALKQTLSKKHGKNIKDIFYEGKKLKNDRLVKISDNNKLIYVFENKKQKITPKLLK